MTAQRILFKFAKLMALAMLCTLPISAKNCPENWPPPNLPPNLPCPESHTETVQLEHNDRQNRLKRLSVNAVEPSFSTDYLNPSEHGLTEYPVVIPVLRVVFDESAFFDTASSTIKPEAFPILRTISNNLLLEPPDVALYIVGHTDSRGNEDYNYNLGLMRANAVAEALARRGLYQATLYRLSLGEGYPIADNTTLEGRAKNRRVEFLFAATPKAAETYIEKIAVSPCIATDENGVKTCRRKVSLEVNRVSVSTTNSDQILSLNREEEALEKRTDLTSVELNERRRSIELRRDRIPVSMSRKIVKVSD